MKHPGHSGAERMSYIRRDPLTARVIYKAQVILRVLGPGAARAFMKGMRLEASLIERVLRAPQDSLRR
jgi:hypothetical protein